MQVNLSAATGDMGILANHVPSIEPLRPGLVEVVESAGASKKWFGESVSSFMLSVCFFPHLDMISSIRRLCDRAPQQQADH